MIESEHKQFVWDNYKIFECVAGSHSYGTSIEGVSDKDSRGIYICPPGYVLSPFNRMDDIEDKENDRIYMDLKKWFNLCSNSNPNIIETLFTDPENYIYRDDKVMDKIAANRDLFLSKKARDSFSGYALSQLKRIKGHNKWINSPKPEKAPEIICYCKVINENGLEYKDVIKINELSKQCFLVETHGSTVYRIFECDQYFSEKLGFFNKDMNDIKAIDIMDKILVERGAIFRGILFVNHDEYKKERTEHSQYWEWKKNRNPVRAKMEEESLFDRKHGMHLIRLLLMAKEIATEGIVRVRRPDAKFLLEIRDGKYDYDYILKMATELDESIVELFAKSSLREEPDIAKIDELYREIVFEYWKRKNLI